MFNYSSASVNGNRVRAQVVKSGVGFGTALAICISWSENYSLLWAIIHGIFSWLYVIYYAIFIR